MTVFSIWSRNALKISLISCTLMWNISFFLNFKHISASTSFQLKVHHRLACHKVSQQIIYLFKTLDSRKIRIMPPLVINSRKVIIIPLFLTVLLTIFMKIVESMVKSWFKPSSRKLTNWQIDLSSNSRHGQLPPQPE